MKCAIRRDTDKYKITNNRDSNKILFLNDTVEENGGCESHIQNLIYFSQKNGWICKLIGSKNSQKGFFRLFNIRFFIKVLLEDYDILHIHNFSRKISPAPILAAKIKRKKVVLTVHDYHLICPKTWAIDESGKICQKFISLKCINKKCPSFYEGNMPRLIIIGKIIKIYFHHIFINWVDYFIFPSLLLATNFSKRMHINAKKINVIGHTIMHTIDGKIEKTDKSTNKILFIGRISKEKGVAEIIEIFLKNIEIVRKKSITLEIIGNGILREDMEKIVLQKSAGDVIQMSGAKDKKYIQRALSEANALIIGSKCIENMPMVIYEAFAEGCPVIAPSQDGCSEVVKDNENGLIYEKNDFNDLMKKILYITQLSKKDIKNIRDKALMTYFKMEENSKKIFKLYKKCILKYHI